MNKFLVFLEQREGVVKKASVSLWNRVQELAALRGDSVVSGILVGPADIRQLDGVIAGDGVVYHAKAESCRLYNQECYTRVVADIFQREACTALYFADTAMSRELAPRLSVRLQASLLTGCTMSDPAVDCVSRPVYSGSFLASFVPKRHQRLFILSSSASISSYSAGGHIDFIDVDPQSFSMENIFSVVRQIVMREGRPDVAEARIIVAGGRGMGGAEGFALLEQLALLLGGAVGASRTAVDEGWRPHAEQIGQTGKTVAPALYFACGISGAVQHRAGIGSAGIVVAINRDRHAPIFDIADYGIAGDVHNVLPKLVDSLKDFLKKQ
ncbi:MAG: electron transfer flavoprotein subunit alpha/FixB family protein [Chlorobiaceae bacterium]